LLSPTACFRSRLCLILASIKAEYEEWGSTRQVKVNGLINEKKQRVFTRRFRSNPVEKLRLVFRMYDYNHSGDIDRNEIERILKSIASVSDEIDYDMIMHWDKNGNGKLTEDEFVDFIMGNLTLKNYFIDLIKTHDS
jgi:hypothetical protein